MKNYTVIIPYKGGPDLLKKALNSIPDREDIQVVVADDNDEPLCPVSPYSRASLEYLPVDCHLGAGHARNCALGLVRGKYILFCDADDWFAPGAFDVFDRYLDAGNDITFFYVDSIRLSGRFPAYRHWRKRIYVHRYLRSLKEDGLRYRWDAPWGKMYKASFVLEEGYVFDETKVSNDDLFSAHTGHAAVSIGADRHSVYVASVRDGSLSRIKSKEYMFANYCVHIEKLAFLAGIGRMDLCNRLWMHQLRVLVMFGIGEFRHYREYAKRYLE